jgi:hypothetical protein
MLDYSKMRDFREGLLRQVEKQVYAITLKNDTVIPSFEILNTLQGAFRTINISVEEFDFGYEYIHENPFPANPAVSECVDEAFNRVFDRICGFLNA